MFLKLDYGDDNEEDEEYHDGDDDDNENDNEQFCHPLCIPPMQIQVGTLSLCS